LSQVRWRRHRVRSNQDELNPLVVRVLDLGASGRRQGAPIERDCSDLRSPTYVRSRACRRCLARTGALRVPSARGSHQRFAIDDHTRSSKERPCCGKGIRVDLGDEVWREGDGRVEFDPDIGQIRRKMHLNMPSGHCSRGCTSSMASLYPPAGLTTYAPRRLPSTIAATSSELGGDGNWAGWPSCSDSGNAVSMPAMLVSNRLASGTGGCRTRRTSRLRTPTRVERRGPRAGERG